MYFWDKHKTITSYYELLSGEVCDRYGLTQMEYDILKFLHNNPHHNTATKKEKVKKIDRLLERYGRIQRKRAWHKRSRTGKWK